MRRNEDILNLGQLVTKLRKEKGYSQRKFAQVSGLSNTTISRIENGETQHPDRDTITLLAAHLDCEEAELLKLIGFHSGKTSYKHARFKFLHQPVKAIKRYSTVSSPEPERLEEDQKKVNIRGMRLITLRMEKNITQKELAAHLEIDKTLISQYEGEILQPDYQTVKQLAEYFGVTVEYLTGVSTIAKQSSLKPVSAPKNNVQIENIPLSQDISLESLAIAKEIQSAGIDIKDVRAFIELLKKYKNS